MLIKGSGNLCWSSLSNSKSSYFSLKEPKKKKQVHVQVQEGVNVKVKVHVKGKSQGKRKKVQGGR